MPNVTHTSAIECQHHVYLPPPGGTDFYARIDHAILLMLTTVAQGEFRIETGRMKGNMLFLIAALFLVSLNLRPAITSVGPLLTTLQQDLGINAVLGSLLTAIPVFCMGLFAPVAGYLGDHWGIQRSVGVCIALIGIATAARFLADSAWMLFGTAVFVGIGIAIAGPLLSGFIKQHFTDKAPVMVGVYSLGIGVGATLSAGLSVPISLTVSAAWRGALGVWAFLALLAFVFWLPLMRSDATTIVHSKIDSGMLPWRNARAWLLLLGFGLQSGIYYSATTWLPAQLQELGFSVSAVAGIITGFSIIQMISNFVIPTLATRSRSRSPWLLGCAIFTLCGLALVGFQAAVSPWLMVLILGIGLGGLFPLMLILPLDETRTGSEASRWTAMMLCGGYIISGIIPIVAGAIKDSLGSFHYAFMALVLLCLIMIVVFLMLKVNKSRSQQAFGD